MRNDDFLEGEPDPLRAAGVQSEVRVISMAAARPFKAGVTIYHLFRRLTTIERLSQAAAARPNRGGIFSALKAGSHY